MPATPLHVAVAAGERQVRVTEGRVARRAPSGGVRPRRLRPAPRRRPIAVGRGQPGPEQAEPVALVPRHRALPPVHRPDRRTRGRPHRRRRRGRGDRRRGRATRPSRPRRSRPPTARSRPSLRCARSRPGSARRPPSRPPMPRSSQARAFSSVATNRAPIAPARSIAERSSSHARRASPTRPSWPRASTRAKRPCSGANGWARCSGSMSAWSRRSSASTGRPSCTRTWPSQTSAMPATAGGPSSAPVRQPRRR